MKAPNVPMNDGAGMKYGGHLHVVPPGRRVMAQLVYAEDGEEREGEHEPEQKVMGGRKRVPAGEECPRDEGGEKCKDEQKTVNEQGVFLLFTSLQL